jgi:spermidine/putrescine transport system permease protein
LFSYSLWQVRTGVIVHALTLQNYADLFRTRLYLEVLLRSARIAGSVTALSLLLGVPLAYLLSFRLRHGKDFLYQLVIVPLWISYLVRAYAWKTILGGNGVLNTLLAVTGALHHPAAWLLYSPFAVVVTLTHIYTPFVFLPVYAAFEHIPKPLVEAAQDLGASRFRTFWTVLFPLALPGIIAGATFAFVLSLGDFIAPLLIGGPNGIMISNVVVSLFGAAFNWPLGAAISVMMLLFVVVLITGAERLEARARYGAAS